jgi:hypothetical protein
MSTRRFAGRLLLTLSSLTIASASPVVAQSAGSLGAAGRPGFRFPVRVSGQASAFGEFYARSNGQARRPSGVWRVALTPRMTIAGEVTVGLDILLSTNGSDLRQNINQLGVSPSWRWGTVYAGDFNLDYSKYTVQGTRIRGGGFDIRPGFFRISFQGGRAQRTVLPGSEVKAFPRNLFAGTIGVGSRSGSQLNVTISKTKDGLSGIESDLLFFDTTFVDTIPEGLRPQVDTRAQENSVVGVGGQLVFLDRRLRIRGEMAASLTNYDLLSQEVDLESEGITVPPVIGTLLTTMQPVRLSSSSDVAYNVDAQYRTSAVQLGAGYERIGAGYSSLGLPYLINDRQAYQGDASFRLFKNKVGIQAKFRHLDNNLVDQKRARIARNTATAVVSWQPSNAVTTTLSALVNTIADDAPAESRTLDSRSVALIATTAFQVRLVTPALLSLSYNFQQTTNETGATFVPDVVVHNWSTTVQFSVSPALRLGPSVSGAFTKVETRSLEQNVFLGFRASARFLDGRMRTNATLSRTFSSGREISGLRANMSYPLTWGTTASLRARVMRYSALADRSAFAETFLTLSLARSF